MSLTFGAHYFVSHPENGRVDLDLLVIDRDLDGGYKCEIRWDLPGTLFDSGSKPLVVSVPVNVLMGGIVMLWNFVARRSNLGGFLLDAVGDFERMTDGK